MILSPSHLRLPEKFSSYRQGQDEIAFRIAESRKRHSLVAAPTGSGKSLVNLTVGRILGAERILYLVSTKNLQRQLIHDFESAGMFSISGHSNYSCAEVGFDEHGEMDDLECTVPRDQCQYYRAVGQAIESEIVVTNYAHWVQLQKSESADRLGEFQLLVCDEAHLVDLLLTDLLSVQLSKGSIRNLLELSLPSSISMDEWQQWTIQAREIAREKLREIKRDQASNGQIYRLEFNRLMKLDKELSRFLDGVMTGNQWVEEKTRQGVKLKPVWVKNQTEEYLFRGVEKSILSSATLLPSDAVYLGIPSAESDFHEVESSFDPKRSPFIFIDMEPRIRIDRRMNDGQFRILMNRIDNFIGMRLEKGRKGIIHSRSYANGIAIKNQSRYAERMLTHESRSAKEVIEQFKRSDEPCVLVSPAVEEGHDFLDDLCRFQVVYKVPFVYSGDPLIEARLKSDKKYTYHLAARSITQMVGRGRRSEEDWCESAIFDDHFRYFRNKAKFSQGFKKTWQTVNRIPEPLDVRSN